MGRKVVVKRPRLPTERAADPTSRREPSPLALRSPAALESTHAEEVWLDLLADLIVEDLVKEGAA